MRTTRDLPTQAVGEQSGRR